LEMNETQVEVRLREIRLQRDRAAIGVARLLQLAGAFKGQRQFGLLDGGVGHQRVVRTAPSCFSTNVVCLMFVAHGMADEHQICCFGGSSPRWLSVPTRKEYCRGSAPMLPE